MITLVDTCVWVDHLRQRSRRLTMLLEQDHVRCHPLIVGELACGNLANRRVILDFLTALPTAPIADHEEVLSFVEANGLFGQGLGWIDRTPFGLRDPWQVSSPHAGYRTKEGGRDVST